MAPVYISHVAVVAPDNRVTQTDAARLIGEATGEPRRAAAIARGSAIAGRSVVLEAGDVANLGSIEARNRVYERTAPPLALAAAEQVIDEEHRDRMSLLATVSCTGYMVPSWDVHLITALGLPFTVARLPITEVGCSGGVAAFARAAEHLSCHPGSSALVVSVELCSLAFHADGCDGNLTSSLLFGDGAAAVRLDTSPVGENSLAIIDSLSYLVPAAKEVLGFNLTDAGLYPLLGRELPDTLRAPAAKAVSMLLRRNGMDGTRPDFFLVHPGGPRVLEVLQDEFALGREALRWSWASLNEHGNMSSAAILDVIARFQTDPGAPAGWGVVMAFGPGISIELLLVRSC